MLGEEVEAIQQIQKIKRERVGVHVWPCGYTVKIERRRVGYVCGGKKAKKEKTKFKKQNEDIGRRKVGTCVEEKKSRKKKKKKRLLCWAKFITNHRDFDKF